MLLTCFTARQTLTKIRTSLDVLQSLNFADKAEDALKTIQDIEAFVMELKQMRLERTLRAIARDWTEIEFDVGKLVQKAFEQFSGKKTSGYSIILKRLDGLLAGCIELDHTKYLFDGPRLVETIDGKKYNDVKSVMMLKDDRLAGGVYIGGRCLPFIGDKLLYSFSGKAITAFNFSEYAVTMPDVLTCIIEFPGTNIRHRITWDGIREARKVSFT